jgi:hypothetical protein
MSLKQQYENALSVRGESCIKRNFKFDVWSRSEPTRSGKPAFYYLGRAGSLRVGYTQMQSVPCSAKFKAMLLGVAQ